MIGVIFLVMCFVLLVFCVICWAVFHLAGGLIHILLVAALVFLVLHFISRRRAV
jgi:hypothetical protein